MKVFNNLRKNPVRMACLVLSLILVSLLVSPAAAGAESKCCAVDGIDQSVSFEFRSPVANPDSVASIRSVPETIKPGDQIMLVITDKNTGDVPLTDAIMVLTSSLGLNMTLTRFSPTFIGGDTNNNLVMDPEEEWEWRVYPITIVRSVKFTATGHGFDPFGNDITAPEHPTEQVELDIEITQRLPGVSALGMGLLAGGLAVGMALMIRRRGWNKTA